MMTVNELLAGWPTNIPMKGQLINNNGCMCAQGQVLHYIGGMTPDDLREMEQEDADRQTAELLGISRAHAVLLRRVNDNMPGAPTCVLTEPETVLGDQAQRVLAFWRHLDAMTADGWRNVVTERVITWDVARATARVAAWDAARVAAWDTARAAAVCAAGGAGGDAGGASNEIQGAAVMRQKGQPFFFLPLFGFASPEEIPL